MSENLISEIEKLSRVILVYELNNNPNKLPKTPSKAEIKSICRKGFDIIHHFNVETVSNPCQTSDGFVWSTEITLTDTCFELDRLGNHAASKVLWDSFYQLKSINGKHLNDVLKFLLLLKQPGDTNFKKQHPFSLSGSDYFLTKTNPFSVIPSELTSFSAQPTGLEPLGEKELFIDRFLPKSCEDIEASKISKRKPVFSLECLLDKNGSKKKDVAGNDEVEPSVSPAFEDKGEASRPLSPWSFILECMEKEDKVFNEHPFDENFQVLFKETLNITKNYGPPKRKKRVNSQMDGRTVIDHCQEEKKLLQTLDPCINNLFYPITKESYIKYVKYLLCGINTDIFVFDQGTKKYHMKVGICLDTITPESLFEFSEEFLEIGSCFQILEEEARNGLKCGNETYCHTIYKAFWKSLLDYLQRHSDRVAEIPESCSLLELKVAAEELHATITSITKLCVRDVGMPSGSFLLSYLFEACSTVRQNQLQQSLLSFLYECTSVYTSKMIEPWLFQGYLCPNQAAVFFVQLNPKTMHRRDRSYYQGIAINEDVVPCFLKEMAQRILDCGRAVHLLELFDPENKFTRYLSSKKYPKMRFCWSEEDLDSLKKEFDEYESYINQLCKEAVLFQNIRRKITEDKDEKIIKENKVVIKTQRDQKELSRNLRKQKQEEQFQMLKQQIQEQMEEKQLREEEDKRLEQKYMEEDAKIKAEEDKIVETEKLRVQKYYRDVSKAMEIVQERNDWQTERLKLSEQRANFLNEDLRSGNNMLDCEGNIILEAGALEENANSLNEILPNDDAVESNATKMPDKEGNIVTENNQNNAIIAQNFDDNATIISDEEGNFVTDTNQCQEILVRGNPERNVPNREDEAVIVCEADQNANAAPKDSNQNFQISEDVIANSSALAIANKAQAEKNRAKVLGCEFSLIPENVMSAERKSEVMTEAMKNKFKVLRAEFDLDVRENEIKQLQCETNKKNVLSEHGDRINVNKTMNIQRISDESCHDVVDGRSPIITEAMKNKIRVLRSEFDIVMDAKVDARNTENSEVLTDAVRNRLMVLGSEIGVERPDTVTVSDAPLTQCQKNRLKVLGTELNTFDGFEKNGNSPVPYANLSSAQRNKKKVMGTELGNYDYEKRNSESSENNINGGNENSPSISEELLGNPNDTHCVPSSSPLIYQTDDSNQFSPLQTLFEKGNKSLDISNLNPEQYLRLLYKSMDIAISAQERLANGAVLKHLLVDENYVSHVYSLRCYFLLHDGEFSRSLTHGLFEFLAKCKEPHEFFHRNALSNILDEALNDTIFSSQNANFLSFQILEMPNVLDHEAYNVLSPFQLSYKVRWPLNIILTTEMLSRYRKIFHLLVSLKRVHWTLNETFHYLKSQAKDKRVDGKRLMNSPHYIKLAVYRHAMTLFIMTLEEHMSTNGLRDAFSIFERDLDAVTTFDQLYQLHVHYIKNLLRSCFLVNGSHDLLSYINELISLGLQFHYTMQSSAWHLVNEIRYEHPKYFALKTIFKKFCDTTSIFHKILRRKVQHSEMKVHAPLLLLIDMKIKV